MSDIPRFGIVPIDNSTLPSRQHNVNNIKRYEFSERTPSSAITGRTHTRHETRLESPPANGRTSDPTQRPCLRAVGRVAARSYAMSFRLLTDATVALSRVHRAHGRGLALYRVQSLKAVRNRTG